MRAFDWDLIRGGHYGQRPCSAAQKGRTHGCTDQAANVKKALANGEPSTHGTKRTYKNRRSMSAIGVTADTEIGQSDPGPILPLDFAVLFGVFAVVITARMHPRT